MGKEPLGCRDNPVPVQQQMSDNRCPKGDAQPFMQRNPREMWRHDDEKSDKNNAIDNQVDLGGAEFLLF